MSLAFEGLFADSPVYQLIAACTALAPNRCDKFRCGLDMQGIRLLAPIPNSIIPHAYDGCSEGA